MLHLNVHLEYLGFHQILFQCEFFPKQNNLINSSNLIKFQNNHYRKKKYYITLCLKFEINMIHFVVKFIINL